MSSKRDSSGFTLIELMIVVAIASILAAVALPSYVDSVRKGRRADAIARISALQQAQERWRANNPAYGTLVDVGIAATVPNGSYTLSVAGNDASNYQSIAQASGAQTADTNCVFMRSAMALGDITLSSGPTNAFANSTALNNRCWNR